MSQPYSRRSDLFLVISPFFSIFPALLLVWACFTEPIQSMLRGGTDAASLLSSARTWALLTFAAVIAGLAVILLVTALAARILKKRGASGVWKDLFKMAALPLVIHVGLCGLMLKDAALPLLQRTQADLQQLEAGTLEERTGYFLPGNSAARLPGYFETERCLTRYHFYDPVTGESFDVFLPDTLNFQPAGEYQSSQSLEWNEENIPQYRLSLTGEFRLVVSAGGAPS